MNKFKITLLAFATLALTSSAAYALDDAARTALMKDFKCLKCHDATEEKDAPSYHKIALKYKGKADAASKLYIHLTTGPMVKIDDNEEHHAKLKAPDADIKAVIAWILAQ
jgi:cytochrome c